MSDHMQDSDPIANALRIATDRGLVWVCDFHGNCVPLGSTLDGDE